MFLAVFPYKKNCSQLVKRTQDVGDVAYGDGCEDRDTGIWDTE